jgi:hypothetical protein
MHTIDIVFNILGNIVTVLAGFYGFLLFVYKSSKYGNALKIGNLTIIFVRTNRWEAFKRIAPKLLDTVLREGEHGNE